MDEIIYNKSKRLLTWRVFDDNGKVMFVEKYNNVSYDAAEDFANIHNYGVFFVVKE